MGLFSGHPVFGAINGDEASWHRFLGKTVFHRAGLMCFATSYAYSVDAMVQAES